MKRYTITIKNVSKTLVEWLNKYYLDELEQQNPSLKIEITEEPSC